MINIVQHRTDVWPLFDYFNKFEKISFHSKSKTIHCPKYFIEQNCIEKRTYNVLFTSLLCIVGFTPLILAATAGHVEVVEILLEHGGDIEAQSERTKDTPLSLACSGGRYEVR